MRTEADKFERLVVRPPVNQDQIGADMAVAVVLPLSGKGVIDVSLGKRLIVRQEFDNWPRADSD
jgi:hypothetical protein